MNFIEFDHWGWNAITVSFVGSVVMAIIQCTGLREQRKKILALESKKSVPMVMYAYLCANFVAFLIYGVRKESLAMIINGSQWIFFYLVYRAANKISNGVGRKWYHYAFWVVVPLMIFTDHPKEVMMVSFSISCIFVTQSPRELMINKDPGAVDLKFVISFIITAIFWTIFLFCIKDWVICAANTYNLLAMIFTLVLWKKYQTSRR